MPASTAAAKPTRWLSSVTLHDVPFAELTVRLQPRAKRNAILEERDGVLRVSVAAAPVDGLANAALCKLLAKRAGIARGRVTVIRGERSREKVVRFEDLSPGELRSALGLDSVAQPPSD